MTDYTNYAALAEELKNSDPQLAAFFRDLASGDSAAEDDSNPAWHRHRQQFLLQLYLARRQQHLNQTDLAARIGIAQSSLARIESGKTNPTLLTLIKIAEALDMQLTLQPRP